MMKDLMVKIRHYLYGKLSNSERIEFNMGEVFEIFSGRVSVLLQEILRITKNVNIRFDIVRYFKDHPNNSTNHPLGNLSQETLRYATESSIESTIFNHLAAHKQLSVSDFIEIQDKSDRLSPYLNYIYIDILPNKNISQEKIQFFEYLQRYLKGNIPDYKLPYKKQKEVFKQEITGLAEHFKARPFFFDITCYSKRNYTPYHTLVGLEEEGEIKIKTLDRYGAIITPLRQAHAIRSNIIMAYVSKRKTILIKGKEVKLPGIYTQQLFSSLIKHSNIDKEKYHNEIDIYENWGYDVNETLEASKKLRIYHAARKINQTIAMAVGIADTIQERKGFGSFRLNPAIVAQVQ